ncbi:asparaginase [Leptolyngbya sp. FACHB-261]|nr:asparaginase [Leptolyngbya sp. FACHB-261]MBD2104220.1 asparaginase [Leptolyngbya sp. FACHB-261]
MTRGKRTQTEELEIRLLREGIVESSHYAEAVVCDTRGRVFSVAGNPETAAFIRSSLKPIQALAVVASGTKERFNLSDKDLAVICSSHQGTVTQSRQVFNILWRCDVDPSQLRCPIPTGRRSPLQHNCSGKHAGMLAVCQKCNWSLESYLSSRHPVQQLVLEKLADLLRIPTAEFISARDDCGVPTYFLQLSQMATLYAHLASGSRLDLECLVRAMTRYPEMVAGDGEFDTELMRLSEGELISKAGAEGVQCIGRVGQGLGLAIKVKDGAKRAKHGAAIHALRQLGWITPSAAERLAEQFTTLSDYKRLEVLGELAML